MAPEPVGRDWPVPLGAAFAALAAGLFIAVAHSLAQFGAAAAFDAAVSRVLAPHRSTALLMAAGRVTHLGDSATLSVLCVTAGVLLWWRGEHGLAALAALATGGNSVLNVSLKLYFERVRPVHDPLYADAEGFSFPSGHTSGSLVTYGMLAYLACRTLPRRWHTPAAVAAVFVVALTGATRVLLQVHFPSDVLAGLASGSAWLALCITVAEALRRRQLRSLRA